ncbi:MAG: T9SS type A sorting domain-containing protein [Phaeodactylibacter sp.]|nr:T9SS type A sorting domain-containing protein [Phaeodactylibacter sp.]
MQRTSTLLCFAFLLLAIRPAPAQVFLEEDFAGGILPDGWVSVDISGNNVNWQGCSGITACGLPSLLPAYPVLGRFGSTTADNGFMAVNSDAAGQLLNDGHISRLTSAPIDCQSRPQVFLQFQTAIGTASNNAAENAILRVMSNAGTQTYRPFSMLRSDTEFEFAPVWELSGGKAYFVTLDISEVAGNQPEVYLEWEWRGNFEFAWLLDDVLLSTENPARPDNAVFFEDFGSGSNGWASNPVFPPDSTWKWEPAGDVGNGFGLFIAGRDAFIHSPTAANGAMAFNADFYNTGGEAPAQGPLDAFVCELISPPIALNGAEEPLALQFTQLGWLGNLASGAPQTQEGARFITSFAYSTNGGEDWSEPINANPYQTPVTSSNREEVLPFNNTAYFPLPEAEGATALRLKLTWAGDLYFWALDDIAIVERPAYDMRANRNFFAVTPNAITPASQLQDETLLCDVINIGSRPAEDVRLEAVVRKKGSNVPVYTDTLFYGNIPVDSLVENVFFGRRLTAQALNETGAYEAFYAVRHNQPDARPEDDTLRWRFLVSDFTFAKELGATRDIAPAESISYSYGNVFYVPNGQGFYACAASVGVGNPGNLQGEDITIILYEWNGEFDNNGNIPIENLQFKTGNSYTFSELDTPGMIHLPISGDENGEMLADGTYYVLVVRYDSFFRPFFIQASDTIDYQATWFVNDSLNHPQLASILDVGNTGTFSTIGFGYNIVPVIRLHLGANEACLSSVEEGLAGDIAPLQLSPNPAGGWVNLQLDKYQYYSNAWIEVTDLSGKAVRRESLADLPGGSYRLDVSRLPPGMYAVRLQSDELTAVGKLVVQR